MRVTNRGAKEPIKNRQNFNANSMSGRWTTWSDFGRLPKAAKEAFNQALHRNTLEIGIYVVYSYATPIAWYSPEDERWYYVDAKYSATTSRHQSIVRMAIDHWNGETWENNYETVTP